MISRSHDLICEWDFCYLGITLRLLTQSAVSRKSMKKVSFRLERGFFHWHIADLLLSLPYQRTIYHIIIENEKGSC